MGWRKLTAIPTLFADIVPHMKKGDVEGPIRSPSGFHLIKLLDTRGSAVDRITKTHVRHILIKPNELITNQDARKNWKRSVIASRPAMTSAIWHVAIRMTRALP